MATPATRDFPLLLCRIGFVTAFAGVATIWWRLSADDRFFVIIIALAGSFALGQTSFRAFCSTLAVFGWVTIGFAFFTLATGYSVAWQHIRVVERTSGIPPLIVGAVLLGIASVGRRLVPRI